MISKAHSEVISHPCFVVLFPYWIGVASRWRVTFQAAGENRAEIVPGKGEMKRYQTASSLIFAQEQISSVPSGLRMPSDFYP